MEPTEPLTPPTWDLGRYFDGVDTEAFRVFRDALRDDVDALRSRTETIGDLSPETIDAWASFIVELEQVSARARHIGSYVGCLSAADARDPVVEREDARLSGFRAEYAKLDAQLMSAIRGADDATFEGLLAHDTLDQLQHSLRRLRHRARQSMDGPLEMLAADLGVTGMSAWGRLYERLTGNLEFELAVSGQPTRRVPFAWKRSLTESPDPEIRRAALRGSNAAIERQHDVFATALNAIAGTRHLLYRRRGISDFLDVALFDSAITRKTLDAMLEAIAEAREIPRRYLRLKAGLLGQQRLGFQDISAPLPFGGAAAVPWHEARAQIEKSFSAVYPTLGDFARMAFDRNWIDAEPRSGKRPGGFCTSSTWIDESRIFVTYNDTLGDVQTLAHELGHAPHNWVMRDMRPGARNYPMTLAESASTFAETILSDELLDDPSSDDRTRALVLATRLDRAQSFMLDVPMRFDFERRFYEERAHGEVPTSRLRELMLEAQRTSYGDALADDELDEWFWASKLHFFITDVSFYNFPYTFGFLFSLSLCHLARREGPDFLPRYEALLRLTSLDTAEAVARKALGVDLESPEFWRGAIRLIEDDLMRFEDLLPKVSSDGA